MNEKILRLAVALGLFSVLGLVSGFLIRFFRTELANVIIVTLNGLFCGLFVAMVLWPKRKKEVT